MLEDPRSESLVSNFAGQWLYLRSPAQVKPDPDAFRVRREPAAPPAGTELFFQTILRETQRDGPVGRNYVSHQRLAEHYGIPNIYGSHSEKVALTDPNRADC
jgi:hypothetical protein